MAGIQKKLKMGVIGVGRMGQYHVNVTSAMNNHKLVGVYDANFEHAVQVMTNYDGKAFASLDNLLSRVDAVTIAVPTVLHYEVAKRALEHNCHVLLEKPMTETYQQASELIELAKARNLILQVGHVERYNGAVMELQNIVTEPLMIQSKRLAPFNPRIKDVGVVLDLLIHDLDIVLNLVDSPIKSYTAIGQKVVSDHEDLAIINLNFENGCLASLTGSRVSQHKERTLQITQDKSFIFLNYENQDIEIHRQASTAYLMTKEEIKYSQEAFVEKLHVHKDNPLKSEHAHFYDCVIDRVEPFVASDNDLLTLEVALASIEMIRKSNEEGAALVNNSPSFGATSNASGA